MQLNSNMKGFALTVVVALTMVFVWDVPPLMAAEPPDLAKQIEKQLSSVQRRIVTDPRRAEKELIDAREMLSQMKKLSPNDDKLPVLTKRIASLEQKLAKRLGRPIGGSAPPKKKMKAPEHPKAAPSTLPSAVTSRLKRMKAALDAVALALEKDQLQTAVRKLDEAKKLMEEIQTRYGARIPDDNQQMKTASQRLSEIADKVSDAHAAAGAATAAMAAAKQKMESQSNEWIAKFSPFFDSSNKLYLRMGAQFNRASEAEREQCRQAYAQANDLMQVYEKVKFPQGKTPQLTSLEQRLKRYLTIYNEQESRTRQEISCRKWVNTLRSYVDVGAGSRKYLVAGATVDEAEIRKRSALLEEAKAIWRDYQRAQFPLGKTPQLLVLEEKMQQRLEEMPESLRQSQALISEDLGKEYQRVLDYLTADTGWQKDPAKKPNLVMERDITPLMDALNRYADTVDPGDLRLAKLRKTMEQIEQQDQRNRAIRAERTYMDPDRYSGDDSEGLRRMATEIVKTKSPRAKMLRVTLPAEDWQEENVVEWTDTTRTALRYRHTRFMTTHLAAKEADGKVYLFGVHLASDRRADGSWGPVHGHVMWSDWMVEENVNKDTPVR